MRKFIVFILIIISLLGSSVYIKADTSPFRLYDVNEFILGFPDENVEHIKVVGDCLGYIW